MPIGASGVSDEEPAWNNKGNLIAYRQAQPADNTSSIWVVDPAKPQSARQLTGDGFIDRRPVVLSQRPRDRVRARDPEGARHLPACASSACPRRAVYPSACATPGTSVVRPGLGARRAGDLRDRAEGSEGREPDRGRHLHVAAPELGQARRLELPRRDHRRACTDTSRAKARSTRPGRPISKHARGQRQLGHAASTTSSSYR